MYGKINGNGKSRGKQPARPVFMLDEALRVRLDDVRVAADFLSNELTRLEQGPPNRLLRATWLLDRASRLVNRAWETLEGR
jgi:hypothetical protein